MIKKFCKYYKPHMKLFLIDMFCAFLVSLCNMFYPVITKSIINDYVPNKKMKLLVVWCIALLIIYLIKAGLNYFIQYWGHVVGVRIQGDMRKDLFSHLEKLPFSYFDENKTGNIMSRIINDLQDVSELAHHGPEDIFLSLLTLIGACVLMVLTVNPWLALIVFSVIPFIVLYAIITRKGMQRAWKKMREETGAINSQVESSISGIRVSKAYNANEKEIEKFSNINEDFKVARAGAYKQMGIFGSGMSFFTDFLYLLVLFCGGIFFYKEIIDIGDFTAYILYITMIISPIRTLVSIFEQIQNGMTGFARFQEIMNLPVEEEKEDAIDFGKFNKKISFNDVVFSYNKEDLESKEILNHVSFELEKGKTLALVGPTGAGKTTICHLLPRFYEIDSGEIKLDDVDIRDMTRFSLRKNIGIVAQDVFLFSGTIYDNIIYGNFNATMEEVIEASKKANIHDFIMSLDEGYNTYVGERGVKLSGGQKQRISIARAFLKNPAILILDEATSALDNATEMQIQKALDDLSVGRTKIVVAHRLSTVKNADKIIVINTNGIEEEGTHEELIKKGGTYASLYQYQFRE